LLIERGNEIDRNRITAHIAGAASIGALDTGQALDGEI